MTAATKQAIAPTIMIEENRIDAVKMGKYSRLKKRAIHGSISGKWPYGSKIAHKAGRTVNAIILDAITDANYPNPIGVKILPSTPVSAKIGENTTIVIIVAPKTESRTS